MKINELFSIVYKFVNIVYEKISYEDTIFATTIRGGLIL